jgi:hypothetical protein
MLDDAAARLGLAPDVPARLIATARRHLADGTTTVADAVTAAATELDIDLQAARQFAALAGDQFDPPAPAVTRVGLPLVNAPAGRGCCRV